MQTIESLETRIDTLEMRIAEQDQMLDDLNATITAQWKQVEALTRQIGHLQAQVQDIRTDAPSPGEEPPPHY
jgi:SlyX protein